MALVLNGSGSITGLSAGGLPDGSVTADDIASTLDLSGKTVTLPAGVGGKVLQAVNDFQSVQYTTNSNSWQTAGPSISFTPVSSSSTIIIVVTGIFGAYDSNSLVPNGENIYPMQRIWDATNSSVISQNDHVNWLFDTSGSPRTYLYMSGSLSGNVANSSTNARTYTLQHKQNNGASDRYSVVADTGMTIFEVA